MEGSRRRSFTDDYKRQAVDLVASSGRSIGSVAKELGLRDSVLRRWAEQRGTRREPTAASRRPTTQATLLHCDLCWSSEMRFRFIEDRRADYPVKIMCDVLGVSPAGYYAWRGGAQRPPPVRNR